MVLVPEAAEATSTDTDRPPTDTFAAEIEAAIEEAIYDFEITTGE